MKKVKAFKHPRSTGILTERMSKRGSSVDGGLDMQQESALNFSPRLHLLATPLYHLPEASVVQDSHTHYSDTNTPVSASHRGCPSNSFQSRDRQPAKHCGNLPTLNLDHHHHHHHHHHYHHLLCNRIGSFVATRLRQCLRPR